MQDGPVSNQCVFFTVHLNTGFFFLFSIFHSFSVAYYKKLMLAQLLLLLKNWFMWRYHSWKLLQGHFTEYTFRLIISYQSSGNYAWNSGSLSFRWNVANDSAALTSNGRVFQARMAVTGNAWSLSVERRVAGTTTVIELAQRRRRWLIDHPHQLPVGVTLRDMMTRCCAGTSRPVRIAGTGSSPEPSTSAVR